MKRGSHSSMYRTFPDEPVHIHNVLPVSGCSPVFSPAPLWQQLTPAGGFVSGVRWLMHECGSTLIAERLLGKNAIDQKEIRSCKLYEETKPAGLRLGERSVPTLGLLANNAKMQECFVSK